ncbi:MAG: hypothetical protein ACLFU0_00390 [Alphaproteobacteria bacterium]
MTRQLGPHLAGGAVDHGVRAAPVARAHDAALPALELESGAGRVLGVLR